MTTLRDSTKDSSEQQDSQTTSLDKQDISTSSQPQGSTRAIHSRHGSPIFKRPRPFSTNHHHPSPIPDLSRIMNVSPMFSDDEGDIQFVAGENVDFEYTPQPPQPVNDLDQPSSSSKKKKKKKKKKKAQTTETAGVAQTNSMVLESIVKEASTLENLQFENMVATAVAATPSLNKLGSDIIKNIRESGMIPPIEALAGAITHEINRVLLSEAAANGKNIDAEELELRQQSIQLHIFQQMQRQLEQLHKEQHEQQQQSPELQQPNQLQLPHPPPVLPTMTQPVEQSAPTQPISLITKETEHLSPTPKHYTPSHYSQHTQHSHFQHQSPRHILHEDEKRSSDTRTSSNSKDKIWDNSSTEERQRIKKFWLNLSEAERRDLVKIEKHTVLEKIREQKRNSCNCAVCGRKRLAIEELESLYETYNGDDHNALISFDTENSQIADEFDRPGKDLFNFGSNLMFQGGILTVADDLLKNDGKKFIDMIEHLAEKRMRREEEMEALADYVLDENEDEEDDYDDGDDMDEENYYKDDEYEYEGDSDSEEHRWIESKRMLQVFAAKLLEQQVMAAYREQVANERQKKFLEELEEENRLNTERALKKQRDKEKKKGKKREQKMAKEQERARKEAEKLQAEVELKAKEAEKLQEARNKRLEQKKIERKLQEEERLKKAQAEKQRELEREQKRKEREKQDKIRQEAILQKAKKEAEKERQHQLAVDEQVKVRDKTEITPSKKQAKAHLEEHPEKRVSPNVKKSIHDNSPPPALPIVTPRPRPKADPILLSSLQNAMPQFSNVRLPAISTPPPFAGTPPNPPVQQQQHPNGWSPLSPDMISNGKISNTRVPVTLPGMAYPMRPPLSSPPNTEGRLPPFLNTELSPADAFKRSSSVSAPSLPPIQRPTSVLDRNQENRSSSVEDITEFMGSSALLADDDDVLIDDTSVLPVNAPIPRNRTGSLFSIPGPTSRLFSDPFISTAQTGSTSNGWPSPFLGPNTIPGRRRGSMWSSTNSPLTLETTSPWFPDLNLNSKNNGGLGGGNSTSNTSLSTNSTAATSNGGPFSATGISWDIIRNTAVTAFLKSSAVSIADGIVPAQVLFRTTVLLLNATATATAPVAGEERVINLQDFYGACASVDPVSGVCLFQLLRDSFGLVTHIKYTPGGVAREVKAATLSSDSSNTAGTGIMSNGIMNTGIPMNGFY